MDTIKHLEAKFSIASYELIKQCEAWELRFYLWLKLWAINKSSAWPSQPTISAELGYSDRQIRRMVETMEASGRLKVLRTPGRNNVYDITFYDRLVVTNMSATPDKNVRTTPDKNVPLTNRNKRIENNDIKVKNFSTTVDKSVENPSRGSTKMIEVLESIKGKIPKRSPVGGK